MRAVLFLLAIAVSLAAVTRCPDGTWTETECVHTPDGKYVNGEPVHTPDGGYVGVYETEEEDDAVSTD